MSLAPTPAGQRGARDAEAARVTPMMAQYVEIKAANPDCLLFYRMGDFYELFFEDAEHASRALGIVLTKRGRHQGEDIPMCGVPVERAEEYLHRLIGFGFRVAVCEQLEDPAEARKRGPKSVVRRDVTRLVTPGTITEDALLEPGRASILLAVSRVRADAAGWTYGLAAADISTGRFTVFECGGAALGAEIARIEPVEIILPDAIAEETSLAALWRDLKKLITPVARESYDPVSAEKRLCAFYGVSTLAGFGALSRAEITAAAAVIVYVERTQRAARPPLGIPLRERRENTMEIDAATRANLELTRKLSGEREGSVLSVIDLTLTPGGKRLLADRLAAPSTDAAEITRRHQAVAFFCGNSELSENVRAGLKRAPDFLRCCSRLAMQRGGPRDLIAIRQGILAAQQIAGCLSAAALPQDLAAAVAAAAAADTGLAEKLTQALADDVPLSRRDGGFIRAGFAAELDELRQLRDQSRKVIAGLQLRYGEAADCRTLRIKHNNFLGYFIEVPQATGEKLLREPFLAEFVHRQTMQGAMRFATAELGELEARITSAASQAAVLEQGIFDQLAAAVGEASQSLNGAAGALAAIDVSASLAVLAQRQSWVRPVIDDSLDFHIEAGRHPVVEATLAAEGKSFTANDIDLSPSGKQNRGQIYLVTGPNMAGKSTFLRQNALIALLAQIGSYVPAKAARIGIVDRLFSRVGAADDLARGRSTFMVEMVETAAILNQAGPRALVILDEIGRGTATFDGLSIAWASVEHLHETNGCRALFATHFHEMTALTKRLSRLKPVTMRVTEWQGDVVFLHEVVQGAADRSYGIQVAKLAGLPGSVVERAKHILAELEQGERQAPVQKTIDDLPLFSVAAKPPPARQDLLRAALEALKPDEMSPKEALEALYRLKGME